MILGLVNDYEIHKYCNKYGTLLDKDVNFVYRN